MKRITGPIALALILGSFGLAQGQTLEMAAKCDDASKQLAELVKKPDITDVNRLKQDLGMDVLDSCDGPKGKVTCFQCLDKSGQLRTLQLRQSSSGGKFEFLGFGCLCRDEK